MRWSNLFVIFRREVRDQIRDRRTLFMIFVLPILLYPILGIGVHPVRRRRSSRSRGRSWSSGPSTCRRRPPLLESRRRRLRSRALRYAGRGRAAGRAAGAGDRALGRPATCASRRSATATAVGGDGDPARPARAARARRATIDIPIQYNSVDEPSQITYLRLKELLDRWQRAIVDGRLKRDQKTAELHRADPGQGRGRGDRAARSGAASGAGSSRSCW